MQNSNLIRKKKLINFRRLDSREIFKIILSFEALVPLVGLLSYIFLHVYLNPYQFYHPINLVYLLFILYYHRKTSNKYVVKFFTIFYFILFINLISYIFHLGFGEGIYDFFRDLSYNLFFIFLGYILFQEFYCKDKLDNLLRYIINLGVFIACVNIIHFILFYETSYYYFITEYSDKINPLLTRFIIDASTFFLRPLGYFFDTHSQYFIPMAALLIIIISDIKIKARIIIITLLMTSLIFSGIKTAWVQFVVIFAFYLLHSITKRKHIATIVSLILLLIIVWIIFNQFIIDYYYSISEKEGPYLLAYLFENPSTLLKVDMSVFIFGGNPEIIKMIDTEVYLIKFLYSFGVGGLVILLIPGIGIFMSKNKELVLGKYLYFYFITSLLHYGVYAVGINIIVPTLMTVYYFIALSKKY